MAHFGLAATPYYEYGRSRTTVPMDAAEL